MSVLQVFSLISDSESPFSFWQNTPEREREKFRQRVSSKSPSESELHSHLAHLQVPFPLQVFFDFGSKHWVKVVMMVMMMVLITSWLVMITMKMMMIILEVIR